MRQIKTCAVESPFRGFVESERYLEKCLAWCEARDFSPYASHKMLTGILDDSKPAQRFRGIDLGLKLSSQLDQRFFFVDHGWSEGMKQARRYYDALGLDWQEVRIEE